MRRRIVSLFAATLLVLLSVLPAAAKGPEHNPLPPEQILFGEEYCGFEVLLEDSFSSVKEHVFPPDADGNQRITTSGVFKSTLTNVEDPDQSTNLNLGGHIAISIRADGSARVQGSGNILVWYSEGAEGAVSELGAGMFLVRGRATELYGPNGLVEATYTGRVTDLCARLAG